MIEKWEHDFVKEKKENIRLQSFLRTHLLQDRLNPRDAFFGGRTNAVKLYHEGPAKYVDFTALYPWVNFYLLFSSKFMNMITNKESLQCLIFFFLFILRK